MTNTIRIVTHDEALLATLRAAVSALEDWSLAEPQTVEDLLGETPERGDVILLDAWMRTENVYESCRRLAGRTRCRTYVVTDDRNEYAEAIAAFSGATGTVARPLSGGALRAILTGDAARGALPSEARGSGERLLPEALLKELSGGELTSGASALIDAITDPETGLFSYEYLSFKLDEEFKRAKRFGTPLSLVMLGFDGQAEESVLAQLAGIFLNASRDTDVLGRFDQSSFLFFLPNTGPDGAEIMAERIQAQAAEEGLRDLVGDALMVQVGISYFPHVGIERKEDLFQQARDAFLEAQREGGIVILEP
ncbi:MAG: diguanylate cyclase [Planctomycetota bacterium]